MREYYTYITASPNRNVLYVGMTNDLAQRLVEHYLDRGTEKSFAGKNFCYDLMHFEVFDRPSEALEREKEIKKWRREKKEALIKTINPKFRSLNHQILVWPPPPDQRFHRRDL